MRRFECPHCNYVNIFAPDGKSKHKKTFVGFSCPRCHKKVTEADIRRNKGSGPKPLGERRKRVKKEVVEETINVEPSQSIFEPVEWKTRDSSHTNPWESQHPGARNNRRGYYTGWRSQSRQPTERTLGDALMVSRNIRPSAPIPIQNLEVNGKLEEREVGKVDIEKLEKHEKKLALMIVRLDRVEERLKERVKELDVRLTELDSKLQAFSTLTSHMETILEETRRKQPRP